MPSFFPSTPLRDDFGSGLGKWSTWRTGAPLIITGGALENDGVNGRCGSYYNIAQHGPNVEVAVRIPKFSGNDELDINLLASTTDGSTASAYLFVVANAAAGGPGITRVTTGTTFTSLNINSGYTFTAGGWVSCSRNNGLLSMRHFRNGVWETVIEAFDTTFSSAGRVALEITNFGGGLLISADDIYIGDLVYDSIAKPDLSKFPLYTLRS